MPMQLQTQYPDLQSMFGQNSLFSTMYGMNREDQAVANAQQNLKQAQQDTQFQAEQHPLDLANLQATTRHTNALAGNTEAMIPGTQAGSNMKVREDQADSQVPMDQRVGAAIAHIAANTSEDQLKAAEDHIYMGLNSKDPAERAQAQQALPNIRAIKQKYLELQQQGQNSARVASIGANAELEKERMGINAGKYDKNSLAGMRLAAGLKGLNYEQQVGVYNNMAMAIQQEASQLPDTDPRKAQLMQEAQMYAQQAQQTASLKQANASAAATTNAAVKPDLNSLGITTVAPPGTVQPGVPQASVVRPPLPASQPTAGMVRMFDPKGVPHDVPKENVGRAQAGGWSTQPNAPSIPTQ